MYIVDVQLIFSQTALLKIVTLYKEANVSYKIYCLTAVA